MLASYFLDKHLENFDDFECLAKKASAGRNGDK
jgi:hypothetical protein